jgi:hypothetical protein
VAAFNLGIRDRFADGPVEAQHQMSRGPLPDRQQAGLSVLEDPHRKIEIAHATEKR